MFALGLTTPSAKPPTSVAAFPLAGRRGFRSRSLRDVSDDEREEDVSYAHALRVAQERLAADSDARREPLPRTLPPNLDLDRAVLY